MCSGRANIFQEILHNCDITEFCGELANSNITYQPDLTLAVLRGDIQRVKQLLSRDKLELISQLVRIAQILAQCGLLQNNSKLPIHGYQQIYNLIKNYNDVRIVIVQTKYFCSFKNSKRSDYNYNNCNNWVVV